MNHDPLGNEANRFGSAAFANAADIRRAGMFSQEPGSLLVGFFEGRPLWYSGAGGVLLTAGARSGKLRDVLAYNLCPRICLHTMLVLDMKGELATISQDQTPDKKFCIYWNPLFLHGFGCNRFNPVGYITIVSPSLVSDVKVLCENLIPESGSAQGQYFEGRAREYLEALILTLTRMHGTLTLPDLYAALNLIPGGSDAWLDFAFEMKESGFAIAARVEEEIAASRGNASNGFEGILGEMFKSLSCLSDPVLLQSISPPYDFSLSDLCASDQAYQLYLMAPAEVIGPWAPILKAIFVGAMIYKSRSPSSPRQTWVLDECAQLGKFPLVQKLYTYGAGIGIRPFAVFQSTDQMKGLAPGAESIIPSSAACQILFGLRDIASASACSQRLGAQTLEYDDAQAQGRAILARQQAMHELLNGGDAMKAALSYRHYSQAALQRTKQHRLLRTPDEVLNTPDNRAYIFADNLSRPIYAERRAYFEQRFMAGRYYPNPYHPPADRVRVKLRIGHGWRTIIREPVPQAFAHYPQYADGTWARLG